VLAGVAAPSAGRVQRPPPPHAYVPERVAIAPTMPVHVWLTSMHRLRSRAPAAAGGAPALVGLDPDLAARPAGALSKGQLQRVVLAEALSCRPAPLVLEPMPLLGNRDLVIPPLEELARERVAAGPRGAKPGGPRHGAAVRPRRCGGARDAGRAATAARVEGGRRPRRARRGPRTDGGDVGARASRRRPGGRSAGRGRVPGSSGWSYLLQEHVEGVDWRGVRPQLDPRQLVAAHRQIATAVLAVQSVRFAGFGELDPGGEPVGADLGQALRRRAEQRIADPRRRAVFCELLEREADLLAGDRGTPTLCHDDLHHANVVFRAERGTWRLAGLLDWDKAWAGPAESDIARMAFWDDMTGPGFWEAYRAAVPSAEGEPERALVHQLLWCLEYPADTPRHRADTAALCRRLGLRHPE
jgi:hypothetical protein